MWCGKTFWLNFIKLFVFTILFVIFIIAMKDVWEKFDSKATTTAIEWTDEGHEKKLLPYLTFCPWPAFRNKELHYSEEGFLKNTFELKDVFDDKTISNITNPALYFLKELRTLAFGRCYTIMKKVTSKKMVCLKTKTFEMQLYQLHTKTNLIASLQVQLTAVTK